MSRGLLRIYLGAAPGVGKTFAMLGEGRRRRDRGTDVVVGFVETHGRVHTAAEIADLEIVPRRQVNYRGQVFEEMDLPAIIARAPELVLVDEMAHTNVPGLEHDKRWQDIEALLDAGIDVLSTVNLQHLESVNDVVARITGVTQRETVPDAVVRTAEQVELVDMTPEALRRRLAHGNVYPAERVDAALANFFRVGNLAALRELALLWLADRVDDDLAAYRDRYGIAQPWETRERVVVGVTGQEGADRVVRRAARMATRMRAELVGVTVRRDDGLTSSHNLQLDRVIKLLAELGGRYVEVVSTDVATALIRVARAENATQLVIGASQRSRLQRLWSGSIVRNAVAAAGGDIDVHVIGVPAAEAGQEGHRSRPRLPAGVPRRRVVGALIIGLVAFPLLTAILVPVHSRPGTLPMALTGYLLIATIVAAIGGLMPGLLAGVTAFLISNWEFTPPFHTLTIADARDALALVTMLVTATTIALLVDAGARRNVRAARAARDARALARIAAHISQGQSTPDSLLVEVLDAFSLSGAELRSDLGETLVSVGTMTDPHVTFPLDEQRNLIVAGGMADADSRELLRGVASQLLTVLDRQALERAAAERVQLAEADSLRSALLAAVSHDLRTPLAAIKASTSTLISVGDSVSQDDRQELLQGADLAADQLTTLIEGLLDLGRINEGAVDLVLEDVDVASAVDSAVREVAGAHTIQRTGDEDATAHTDETLLVRIVANLISNALAHGAPPIIVDIGHSPRGVAVRVIDHGSGIDVRERDRVFEPFQRQGDVAQGRGLGLGLAISRGLSNALGAELAVEDTPGGGCTMTLTLPVVGD